MESNIKKLVFIKLIHTLIWIFFNLLIIYLFYALMNNKIGKLVWICLGLFAVEGIVLLLFKMTCPLTLLARRFSDSNKDNFDIYLPNWLARYTKLIYTTLLIIILVLLIIRLYNN